MTNITQYPALNSFKTTLNLAYAWGTGTISLTNTPGFTFPSGKTVLLWINMWKTNEQVVRLNSRTNVVSISVKKNANNDLYTAQNHLKGDECVITDFFEDWDNIATAVESKSNIASPVFTGSVGLPKYADATARDTAIPSPTGNELILTWNLLQTYNTATTQRETKDAGTPPPQATTTAQGIIELATEAEATTGTDTERAMTPATTKAVIDNIDQSALYETWLIAGESITANDHIRKWVSWWSESTSKRYKASASTLAWLPTDYSRIATSSAVLDGTFSAVFKWLYPYPWLTANTIYYASNTAWLISATPGTIRFCIWETDSQWQLKLNTESKVKVVSASDTVRYLDATTVWANNTSVNVLSITCPFVWSARIKAQVRRTDTINTQFVCTFYILRNWSTAYSTTTTSNSFIDVSYDVSFVFWDVVVVWFSINNGAFQPTAECRNVSVWYTVTGETTDKTFIKLS